MHFSDTLKIGNIPDCSYSVKREIFIAPNMITNKKINHSKHYITFREPYSHFTSQNHKKTLLSTTSPSRKSKLQNYLSLLKITEPPGPLSQFQIQTQKHIQKHNHKPILLSTTNKKCWQMSLTANDTEPTAPGAQHIFTTVNLGEVYKGMLGHQKTAGL